MARHVQRSKIAVAVPAALLLLPVLIAAAVGGALHAILGNDNANAAWSCTAAGIPNGVAGYQPDQIANAATIAAIGKQIHSPSRGS